QFGTVPIPLEGAEVRVLRLDPDTGDYTQTAQLSTNSNGYFVLTDVLPGLYTVRIRDTSGLGLDVEYYDDKRFLFDADTVEVVSGDDASFGTIVLAGRSLELFRMAGSDRYATNVAIAN